MFGRVYKKFYKTYQKLYINKVASIILVLR